MSARSFLCVVFTGMVLGACSSNENHASPPSHEGTSPSPSPAPDTRDASTPSSDGGSEAGTAPPPTDGETTTIDCTTTTCLYVTPDGNGAKNGADWANAFANLPAKLVRGAAYYLAGGAYGDHVFDDEPSGAKTITIKRATEADHGTSTGWLSAYGDGKAELGGLMITADHYVFDGARRNADWRTGGLDQYGITAGHTRLDDAYKAAGHDLTFRRIDFHGDGRDKDEGDDVIYGVFGNTNITFQACALHDSSRTLFLMRGNWQALTVDRSYLARNTSTPATHGELLSMMGSDGVVFSNNVIEDIEGTAVFAGIGTGLDQHWKIYGNTVVHTAAYLADTGRKPGHNFGVSGFVYCANDATNDTTCNDFQVYQNTLVNIQGTFSGVVIQSGSGNVTQNNIWYKSVNTNNYDAAPSYNWYFDTPYGDDVGPTDVVCTSNCEIFVDLAKNDFHLARATAPGVVLPAPFATDPDGVVRGGGGGWARGAFEQR